MTCPHRLSSKNTNLTKINQDQYEKACKFFLMIFCCHVTVVSVVLVVFYSVCRFNVITVLLLCCHCCCCCCCCGMLLLCCHCFFICCFVCCFIGVVHCYCCDGVSILLLPDWRVVYMQTIIRLTGTQQPLLRITSSSAKFIIFD